MRAVGALVGLMLVVAACANANETRGIVLEVNGDLTSVESFVIRTDAGEILTVVPAPDGDFAFPLPHLNDHRTTLAPIIVELDSTLDPPRALHIRDADSAEWHDR